MKKLVKLVLLTAALCPLISIATSCSEEADCSMNARPLVGCNIYTINRTTNTLKKDTLDSLTITAYGTDSILVNRLKKVHTFWLPLQYTIDSTKLVFHYTNTKSDTVVINHTNTPYFLSMDCGYQMIQEITKIRYTRHDLDSINITNNEAGIYGKENLKLFY